MKADGSKSAHVLAALASLGNGTSREIATRASISIESACAFLEHLVNTGRVEREEIPSTACPTCHRIRRARWVYRVKEGA